MLYAGASTTSSHDLVALNWSRSHCAAICQKLHLVTVEYLRPLERTYSKGDSDCEQIQEEASGVDDVMTYVIIATIVSSSKGELAGLRW